MLPEKFYANWQWVNGRKGVGEFYVLHVSAHHINDYRFWSMNNIDANSAIAMSIPRFSNNHLQNEILQIFNNHKRHGIRKLKWIRHFLISLLLVTSPILVAFYEDIVEFVRNEWRREASNLEFCSWSKFVVFFWRHQMLIMYINLAWQMYALKQKRLLFQLKLL